MRILVLVLSWLVMTTLALAQVNTKQFCHGKYENAKATISKPFEKYGTLYAGGNFFSRYNQDLRPTIDAYRLLTNQPVLSPEKTPDGYTPTYNMSGYRSRIPEQTSTYIRVHNALKTMTQSDPQMHKGQVEDAVINLDLLTSRGPADDWWLRPDDYLSQGAKFKSRYDFGYDQEKFAAYRRIHLSNAQKHIADIARENEALDWLQSALILSVDRYPWRHNGKNTSTEMQNLLAHIETRALETEQINEWYALFSHHKYYGRPIPAEIQIRADAEITKLQNCQATPQAYAALVAGGFNVPDDFMPPLLLQQKLVSQAKSLTVNVVDKNGLDIGYYYEIEALKDRAPSKSAFALPLLLSSPSIREVKQAHELSKTVTRPLLWLRTDDLARISPGTAFTHYISLGEEKKASNLLNDWFAESPQNREPYTDILDQNMDDKITVSLVSLRMRCLSHFMSSFCQPGELKRHQHRNLGSRRNSSDFIRLELAEWLYPSWRYNNMHQSYYHQYLSINTIGNRYDGERREIERVRDRPPVPVQKYSVLPRKMPAMTRGPLPNLLPKNQLQSVLGLAAMADPDKLKLLAAEKRFLKVLSLNIVNWVNDADEADIAKHRNLMAEALHLVIKQNKHEDSGEMNGQPIVQKAYQLLHGKFGDTEWAGKTPYWWPPRREHG